MEGMLWNDLHVGLTLSTRARTVSETDIVNFVNGTGFVEPLFLDMEYVATQTEFGRRIAPGLLTLSLAEGLILQAGHILGTAIALMALDVTIRHPVHAGDTIKVQVEVVESRPTSRTPERGVVTTQNNVLNQEGVVVMEYQPTRLISGRDPD